MNETMSYLFFYAMGQSLGAAILAFICTLFRKKGSAPRVVGTSRRLLSLVIIYAVCFAVYFLFRATVHLASVPNPQAYESPGILIAAIAGYFAGKRVIETRQSA